MRAEGLSDDEVAERGLPMIDETGKPIIWMRYGRMVFQSSSAQANRDFAAKYGIIPGFGVGSMLTDEVMNDAIQAARADGTLASHILAWIEAKEAEDLEVTIDNSDPTQYHAC